MGNQQTPRGEERIPRNAVSHPLFSSAKLTINKKMVVEHRFTEEFTELAKKIYALKPQEESLPLLLPKMEMSHSESFCSVDKTISVIVTQHS